MTNNTNTMLKAKVQNFKMAVAAFAFSLVMAATMAPAAYADEVEVDAYESEAIVEVVEVEETAAEVADEAIVEVEETAIEEAVEAEVAEEEAPEAEAVTEVAAEPEAEAVVEAEVETVAAEPEAEVAEVAAAEPEAPVMAAAAADPEPTLVAAAAPVEAGDFAIEAEDDGAYEFDDAANVLYIFKDVTVSMREGVERTTQSIVIAGNVKVTLNGVNIDSKQGPAILIESPYSAEIILAEGTMSELTGANGTNINHVAGSFAGIEVEFEYESGENPSNRMASLIISGNGTLNVTGATNAAGIGGSNSAGGSKGKGLYGNITINGGTINATSPGNGAGIGSSDTPGDGTSSGSYKKTGNNTWGVITINGGTVNAVSKKDGAGIGGGNHVDSGKIVINGGMVTADGAAGIGCGVGSSKNKGNGGDKGPGYYVATVEINGGTITATSSDIGAAIGGGMYCDAVVTITGGTVNATGGSRSGSTHHGGAGIGGGYLGNADITITGGTINAIGGDGAAGIGSGGSPNSNSDRGVNGRGDDITAVKHTTVAISGGTINATGGPQGGAGIGLGVGAAKGAIVITGGDVTAVGAASNSDAMRGGAGVGSAFSGVGSGSAKYFVDADVSITIGGDANVTAIGGWGASGIGSGADNKSADSIVIDTTNATVQAYADGTKFAIDTRDAGEGAIRNVTGYVLQGTFVFPYEHNGIEQGTAGLDKIYVINDATGATKMLVLMPQGYRSYATDVAEAGAYVVYTDSDAIGNGEGRYFSVSDDEEYQGDVSIDNLVQYMVSAGKISDNNFMFPVKTIVVSKLVLASDDIAEDEQADFLAGINETFYFALRAFERDADGNKIAGSMVLDSDGNVLILPIEVVNGVATGRAFFVGLSDSGYDVLEVNANGESLDVPAEGIAYETGILQKIRTRHGDGTDNNGVISEDQWTDEVTVVNTFTKEAAEDPEDPEDSAPQSDVEVDDEGEDSTPQSDGDVDVDVDDEPAAPAEPMAPQSPQMPAEDIEEAEIPLAEQPVEETVPMEQVEQPAADAPAADRVITATTAATPQTGDAFGFVAAAAAVLVLVAIAALALAARRLRREN